MRDGLGGIDTVALIGGTSEIGLAIAHELKALGASRFVLAGRDPELVEEASGNLPVANVMAVDAADVTAHRDAVHAIFSGGDIDVVVVAAGVLHTQPNAEQIAAMALVNGAGSVSLLAEVADQLRAQGHGQLIVLSSMAVVRPRPSNYWYGASKAALDFAARGLADELEDTGVQVTVIRPGFVHSKMTKGMAPAPFASKSEDVARAVADAVQKSTGGVIWVPKILRMVSFLLQWLPRPLLHRLDR